MLRISDMRTKEVINVIDGRRLGYIGDLDIDLDTGRVKALIVPGPTKILGLFGKEDDFYLNWERIVKIGTDVILIELPVGDVPYIEGDEY